MRSLSYCLGQNAGAIGLSALMAATLSFGYVGMEGINENYSKGSRIGVVTKLSEKGNFVKSWEAEAIISGDSANVTNTFAFNVSPKALPKVRAAMKLGNKVELSYSQYLINPFFYIENNTVVHDVKSTTPPEVTAPEAIEPKPLAIDFGFNK